MVNCEEIYQTGPINFRLFTTRVLVGGPCILSYLYLGLYTDNLSSYASHLCFICLTLFKLLHCCCCVSPKPKEIGWSCYK